MRCSTAVVDTTPSRPRTCADGTVSRMDSINWLACLVAFLAIFASGFAWFNGATFFPVWWRLMGRGDAVPGEGGSMTLLFGSQAAAIVAQVLVLEVVLDRIGGDAGLTAAAGAGWSALLGAGAAAAMLGHRLFAGHGWRVWMIEAGNDVLNWTLIGLILSTIG